MSVTTLAVLYKSFNITNTFIAKIIDSWIGKTGWTGGDRFTGSTN